MKELTQQDPKGIQKTTLNSAVFGTGDDAITPPAAVLNNADPVGRFNPVAGASQTPGLDRPVTSDSPTSSLTIGHLFGDAGATGSGVTYPGSRDRPKPVTKPETFRANSRLTA